MDSAIRTLQLTDMGFPEDQAVAALSAANGNSDLAVEFLMNGIPEGALPTVSRAIELQ